MPTKIKMEFMHKGFRQILLNDNTKQTLEEAAETVASQAGDGYESETHIVYGDFGGGRLIAHVKTVSREAAYDQAVNHTLEEAVSR